MKPITIVGIVVALVATHWYAFIAGQTDVSDDLRPYTSYFVDAYPACIDAVSKAAGISSADAAPYCVALRDNPAQPHAYESDLVSPSPTNPTCRASLAQSVLNPTAAAVQVTEVGSNTYYVIGVVESYIDDYMSCEIARRANLEPPGG